jgi:hypothetical protein
MKPWFVALAFAAAVPAVGRAASDFTIVPGNRFGPIRETTARASLATAFPPAAVEDVDVDIGEGFCAPGTRIFGGTPDEIDVTWQDEARSRVAFVRTQKPGARWSTARGVRIGTSLMQLERMAGHVVTFSGFGWDYGGSLDWSEGRGSIGVRLSMAGEDQKLTERELESIYGDRPVRSDVPAARKVNIRVEAIVMSWGTHQGEHDCR